MRVSTSMIFDNAVTSMQSQTTSMLHTQQQIATGNRLVSPSDDPAAAAQALQVSQAKAVNAQYAANQGSAKSTLSLADSQLQAAGNLVQYVQQRVIQANSGALTDSDRAAIAMDIKAQFEELSGIANSTDGIGQSLFAGNKGTTTPFTANIAGSTVVTYNGDDGQRALQVSSSRQLPVNDPGSALFLGTATAAVATTGGALTATVQNDGSYSGHNYSVAFSSTTAYTITDNSVVPAVTTSGTYAAGTPITVGGLSMSLSGSPGAGDAFSVSNSGGNAGIFNTLANVFNALATPTNGSTTALASIQSQLSAALGDLDATQSKILNSRASIGSRLTELDALGTANADLNVQYSQILSDLQDTDYNKAISQLTQQQIGLQAAQKSFIQTSSLSLFNYIQ